MNLPNRINDLKATVRRAKTVTAEHGRMNPEMHMPVRRGGQAARFVGTCSDILAPYEISGNLQATVNALGVWWSKDVDSWASCDFAYDG